MIEPTDLIGTWKFTRDGLQAFLHFTYTQAFDYLQDGEGHQLLRLWYALEDPSRIRFRNHPDDEGWICGVALEGGKLTIAGDDLATICTRAKAEEIPAWFVQELARG
jgi:hypothetical protein